MPFMSGVPIVSVPPTDPLAFFAPRFYESRSLSFQDLEGKSLLDWGVNEDGIRALICRQAMTGLDFPPRDLVRSKRVGMAGSRLRSVDVGEREVFLPLFISGSNHGEYLSRRDEVASMLDYEGIDYQSNNGTFDLVATSERSVRTLRCMYESGLEGDYAADVMGNWWESFGLTLLAVQPYWQGGTWTTEVVRTPSGARWFGRFPGRLASSRALGADMRVLVDGDAPSWAEVDVTGPADSVTIQSTSGSLLVTVPAGLDTGESFQLTTDPRNHRQALFGGVQDWTRVGPSDTYGDGMPPGVNDVSIVVPGANSTTSARVHGPSLFKRAF